jgi:hypothetical protein
MRGLSRRRVLSATAGASLVAASTGLVVTPAAATAVAQRQPGGAEGATAAVGDPILIRLRDRNTGALDLFVGAQRIQVRDPELVARIVAAAQA